MTSRMQKYDDMNPFTPQGLFIMFKKYWQKIRTDLKVLRDGPPGQRFQNFVDYRLEKRGKQQILWRLLTFSSGLFLILFGLAIGWLPGPGGFVAFIGIGIIIQEIPIIAKWLDQLETGLRSCLQFFKKQKSESTQ